MSVHGFIRCNRPLPVAIVAAVAALSLLQVAQAGPPAPAVPDEIAVRDGTSKVFLIGHAVGVQIYSCNGVAWEFVAPRADLYDDHGNLIVTHFGGPTWKAVDGSTAVGQLVDGGSVMPDLTAIPWLLLSTTTAAGADGDRLVETTFIQRIETVGGVAPPARICVAGTAGARAEVPYTADYVFWK